MFVPFMPFFHHTPAVRVAKISGGKPGKGRRRAANKRARAARKAHR